MQGSNLMTVAKTQDYELQIEYAREVMVLHCPRIDRMTPSVYLSLNASVEEVSEFAEFHGYPTLHAAVPEDDPVGRKLAERMGFEYVGNDSGYDVFEYGEL